MASTITRAMEPDVTQEIEHAAKQQRRARVGYAIIALGAIPLTLLLHATIFPFFGLLRSEHHYEVVSNLDYLATFLAHTTTYGWVCYVILASSHWRGQDDASPNPVVQAITHTFATGIALFVILLAVAGLDLPEPLSLVLMLCSSAVALPVTLLAGQLRTRTPSTSRKNLITLGLFSGWVFALVFATPFDRFPYHKTPAEQDRWAAARLGVPYERARDNLLTFRGPALAFAPRDGETIQLYPDPDYDTQVEDFGDLTRVDASWLITVEDPSAPERARRGSCQGTLYYNNDLDDWDDIDLDCSSQDARAYFKKSADGVSAQLYARLGAAPELVKEQWAATYPRAAERALAQVGKMNAHPEFAAPDALEATPATARWEHARDETGRLVHELDEDKARAVLYVEISTQGAKDTALCEVRFVDDEIARSKCRYGETVTIEEAPEGDAARE